MKIVDVQTFLVGNVRPYHGGQCWLFVKLISDEGIEGVCLYADRRDLGES